MLRRIEASQKCYEPIVVSLSPFHHGKELKITEEHKHTMALQYAHNNAQLLEGLYNKFKAVAGDARNCNYEGSIQEFDEEQFTNMIFLDGCFILQFIHCYANGNWKDLKMKLGLAALVRRDLLLLENQVPFQVLKELMRFKEANWNQTFSNFIPQFRGFPDDRIDDQIQFDQCAHLIDMIHQTMVINKAALTNEKRKMKRWTKFHSIKVKELRAAGIHFRQSKGHQWTDVEFRSISCIGILKLPCICIDDSTRSMLLNMVAYEACPDAPDDWGVSSYVCFINSLIDHVEDVQELRSKGILHNYLGSDQQVADLFNEITENFVSNPYVYADVLDRLESHYNNRIKFWLAEWLHTQFSSPGLCLLSLVQFLPLSLVLFRLMKLYIPMKVQHQLHVHAQLQITLYN